MDDKLARSWAKHTIRQTNTSCRLTLELSGGEAVRLERVVRFYSLTIAADPIAWICAVADEAVVSVNSILR